MPNRMSNMICKRIELFFSTKINMFTCPKCKYNFSLLGIMIIDEEYEETRYDHLDNVPTFCPSCGERMRED